MMDLDRLAREQVFGPADLDALVNDAGSISGILDRPEARIP
jgi:hypothetical protein